MIAVLIVKCLDSGKASEAERVVGLQCCSLRDSGIPLSVSIRDWTDAVLQDPQRPLAMLPPGLHVQCVYSKPSPHGTPLAPKGSNIIDVSSVAPAQQLLSNAAFGRSTDTTCTQARGTSILGTALVHEDADGHSAAEAPLFPKRETISSTSGGKRISPVQPVSVACSSNKGDVDVPSTEVCSAVHSPSSRGASKYESDATFPLVLGTNKNRHQGTNFPCKVPSISLKTDSRQHMHYQKTSGSQEAVLQPKHLLFHGATGSMFKTFTAPFMICQPLVASNQHASSLPVAASTSGRPCSRSLSSTRVGSSSEAGTSGIVEHRCCLCGFSFERLIGSGGYSKVYRVRSIKSGRLLALKAVPKDRVRSGKHRLRRALAEREVLSTCQSPFVLELLCAFQTESHLFLVTEFCPGGTAFE